MGRMGASHWDGATFYNIKSFICIISKIKRNQIL
jgi:hypothetical protein